MQTLHGEGVSRGIAIGPVKVIRRQSSSAPRRTVEDPGQELARFEAARQKAVEELGALYGTTREALGEEGALLFQIHQMMLEDLDYLDAVTGLIQDERVNAEFAVEQAAAQFSQMFSEMDDEYMKARAADVVDVSRRVSAILEGKSLDLPRSDVPYILAADDLAPSETARLDRTKVLAFVTTGGSYNSHTAIFARTMGIPAVTGLADLDCLQEDCQVFVDGGAGTLVIEPDAQTTERVRALQQDEVKRQRRLETYRGRQAVTQDGRRVEICANVGGPGDLDAVLDSGADGIGLFRSEFLYLGRDTYPTEEDQYQAYRQAVQALDGKRVIIRTLDIGADKQAAYFNLEKEENPAMGLRAIRICLTRPDVFKTQLRALYRASAHGRLAIMLPMIASVWEVQRAKEQAAAVRAELEAEGIAFDPGVELGIMIETPAAAVISDLLAAEADFFSIGTNDLTQYTLAADRQNAAIAPFCDRHHEALLRLIRMTVENAHRAGIWAGICGELAADLDLTDLFLEIGVDELSVTPRAVLEVKAAILEGKAGR